MQLIKRIRVIPGEKERYILVNGMNGLLDLIDETVYQLYRKWSEMEFIVPTSDEM